MSKHSIFFTMRIVLAIIVASFSLESWALSGEGTEESPFLIGSEADWMDFMSDINNGVNIDKYYQLSADITTGMEECFPTILRRIFSYTQMLNSM